MTETGQISINTENILPIIKKWLYSERDIFVRELVSNAADAILKRNKLEMLGEAPRNEDDDRISINVDATAKTIVIEDNGLGMSADEIKKYINQVAFSGVEDFVKNYEGKSDEEQIIGHFGLGFYSAFMVAQRVEIETLSFREGSTSAHWESDGSANFTLKQGSRSKVGTKITLHMNSESEDFLEPVNLRTVVNKYCGFLKQPVFLNDDQINETRPLWTENAAQLKEDDYREFYTKVFGLANEPLFWIHLNVDYPFKLRGILFFPRLSHELTASEGEVKLFCNQVYVEDNCKELIPEYLTLLKGVIDCPDLPLNVSRSTLQRDVTVQKIAQHITKKVADKLTGMFNVDRGEFEKYWDDINPFIKYSMMRDETFNERLRDCLLFRATNDKYLTIKEYLEAYGEKTEKKILYTSHSSAQASFIKLLQNVEIEALKAERVLDQHFLPYVEMSSRGEWKFQRVDADLSHILKSEDAPQEIIDPKDNLTPTQKLESLFRKHLGKEQLKVKVESLDNSNVPAMLLIDESMRRLKEMSQYNQFGSDLDLNDHTTLVINRSSPAIRTLLSLAGGIGKDAELKIMIDQMYDLAVLQQGFIKPEAMQAFIDRSATILAKVGVTQNATGQ